MNSAVGTAAKLATVLIPELKSWFNHQLTFLPKIDTPIYDELEVEPIEQLMKPFFGDNFQTVKDDSNAGNTNVSRVQWAQV